MSLYNADNKINTTYVDGSSFTGLYASDGSWNVVVDDVSNFGIQHPSGALRVSTDVGNTYQDPSGAVYLNKLGGPGTIISIDNALVLSSAYLQLNSKFLHLG